MRHEAAEADQAGVERLRPVRHDLAAHDRVDAVCADQEIAFGGGAVSEIGDDRLIATILDLDQAFLEME
nr:hypothetical protein [Bradyrhizobium vignae]